MINVVPLRVRHMTKPISISLAILLVLSAACNQQKSSTSAPPAAATNGAQANDPDAADNVAEFLEEAKRDRARSQAFLITTALKTWYVRNAEYPESLNVLIEPPVGKPILEGGKEAITDPWGKPFQFAVTNRNNVITVEVWTTDSRGFRINSLHK